MDFWVTNGGRKPVGPVGEALVLEGIEAGMIPSESLVCEVGGTKWRPIGDVPSFAEALSRQRAKRHANGASERTIIEPYPFLGSEPPAALQRFDDSVDHTIADRAPRHSSAPPARPPLQRFDETEEKTVVDAGDPASEPPH